LRERLRADLVRKVGELTAIVHQHGAGYVSESPHGALVADQVLYFRAPSRLGDLRPTYGSVLADAVERAQRSLDELWRHPPHPPHLLHGDVHPGNVMVAGGAVVLLDFQDLIWGFEVQDVSIALLCFESSDDVRALSDAFRSGYASVRPFPDADAETLGALRAARHLNILDFGLNMGRPGFEEFIARNAGPVVEWMTRRMK
jgi:Ser/Thr protein kinase RdoA (MazF antagonist)